mmetsp:Transcript_22756/g.70377  ORF Transcript_22756/g.70377 Transcript_22756/m.70377 type:complete len:282 (-) Transcript_22756:12-857(-)
MNGNADDEKSGLVQTAHDAASPPKVPHNRFLAALAVYSAPLVYALLTDDMSSDDPFLEADASVGGLAAFVALAALLYAAQRGLAAAGRWKFNEKTAADRKEDLLRQSLLCGLAYAGGAIGARLAARPLGFAALVAAYTFGYCVLFELLRYGDVEFTKGCVRNGYALAVFGYAVALVGGLVWHVLAAVAAHDGSAGLLRAGAWFVLVVGGHAALSAAPGRTSAHFHHWYTGFVGSLFCVLKSDACAVAHAMLLGIFLHGAALFGVERVYYPEDGAGDEVNAY